MPASHEWNVKPLKGGENIMYIAVPKSGRYVSLDEYTKLTELLTEEFGGAEMGNILQSGQSDKEVIIFPTKEDCTAFKLRYGDVYQVK